MSQRHLLLALLLLISCDDCESAPAGDSGVLTGDAGNTSVDGGGTDGGSSDGGGTDGGGTDGGGTDGGADGGADGGTSDGGADGGTSDGGTGDGGSSLTWYLADELSDWWAVDVSSALVTNVDANALQQLTLTDGTVTNRWCWAAIPSGLRSGWTAPWPPWPTGPTA